MADKAVILTAQGRVSSKETVSNWNQLWERVRIAAAESIPKDGSEVALFEDVNLEVYAAIESMMRSEFGEMQTEQALYEPTPEGDPRVIRLNQLYSRLKAHITNQNKKSPARPQAGAAEAAR